jgi:hypothetical protein
LNPADWSFARDPAECGNHLAHRRRQSRQIDRPTRAESAAINLVRVNQIKQHAAW